MEKNAKNPAIKKRVRTVPQRKWSNEVVQVLLDYLKENKPIEAPTALIYYGKFCQSHPELMIEKPDLARQKVVHLKNSYLEAQKWMQQSGNGVHEVGETIPEFVNKKWPFFKDLEEIFSEKKNVKLPRILDSENDGSVRYFASFTQKPVPVASIVTSYDLQPTPSQTEQNDCEDDIAVNDEAIMIFDDQTPVPLSADTSDNPDDSGLPVRSASPEIFETFGRKRRLNEEMNSSYSSTPKKKYKQTAATSSLMPGLSSLVAERASSSQLRLEFEKEKFEAEKVLEEKRLAIEESKNRILENDLKEKNELERRRLEIDEKIRMQELKYKYGIVDDSLNSNS